MKLFKISNNHAPIQTEFAFPKTNNRNTEILITLAFIMFMFLLFPILAKSQELEQRDPVIKASEHTATLNLSATNNLATSSDTFTLDINVDPGGQAINAVGIFLGFASSSVTALEINTDNSFCEFFIETSINQETSLISIFCGKPYPGIVEQSNIAQISFKKNTSGWTNFEIKQNSLVLANDGFGTNVLKEINSIDLLIN